MLTPAEWAALATGLPQLAQALDSGDATVVVSLSEMRRATISDFKKGELSVDVREWYSKDGELKPGQKGVMMDSAAFKVHPNLATDTIAGCTPPALGPHVAPRVFQGVVTTT